MLQIMATRKKDRGVSLFRMPEAPHRKILKKTKQISGILEIKKLRENVEEETIVYIRNTFFLILSLSICGKRMNESDI